MPGTVRVWSAVADTPQSTGCVVWDAAGTQRRPRPRVVFSPGRARRASARELSCPTPAAGRHRVTDGSGVTLSFREGSRPREATCGGDSVTSQSPSSRKTQRQTHAPQESVHVDMARSTKDTACERVVLGKGAKVHIGESAQAICTPHPGRRI